MRPRHVHARLLIIAAGAAMLMHSQVTARQPEPAEPSPAKPAAADEPRESRDLPRQLLDLPLAERRARFREFLVGRLDRTDRTRTALAEAIKAIDDGRPLDDIVADYPADLRPGWGSWNGGGGEFRGGRPRGMPPAMAPDDDLQELGPVMPGGDPLESRSRNPRHGPPGESEARGPITDDERAAFDEFLASAAPGVHRMLGELRARDPERADRKLREGLPRIRWLLDLRKRDPVAYKLRLDDIRHGRVAFEAARALAAHDRDHADDQSPEASAERERLSERVRTALREQYDVRGRLLEHEISRLDQDLTRRKAELAKRPGGREAAIGRTVDTLRERARDWLRSAGKRSREQRPDEASPRNQD